MRRTRSARAWTTTATRCSRTARPASAGTRSAAPGSTLNLRLGWRPEFLGNTAAAQNSDGAPRAAQRGVKFYAQAWNVLSETNFTRYAGVMTSPYYLQPTAAGPARRLDFGTRVFF